MKEKLKNLVQFGLLTIRIQGWHFTLQSESLMKSEMEIHEYNMLSLCHFIKKIEKQTPKQCFKQTLEMSLQIAEPILDCLQDVFLGLFF